MNENVPVLAVWRVSKTSPPQHADLISGTGRVFRGKIKGNLPAELG